MPQLSRRTFSTLNRYETVVFCEGTTPADFEMVELQDYQNAERQALQRILVTDGALGTGFLAVGSGLSNAVNLTLGAALSNGQRLLLPDVLHPSVAGSFIYAMPTATPVANRVDLIYLSVSVTDVTSTQDPNIEDPTLGPSAYREQVSYQILLAQGAATVPALPQGSWGFPIALVQRYAGQAAVNAADVTDVRAVSGLSGNFSPENLITVSPAGAQFNNVQDALDSISGSSETNQFIVLVGPGTYSSNSAISIANPYVTLMGYDPDTTVIRVNVNGGPAFSVSASNVTIANLGLDLSVGATGSNTIVSVGSVTGVSVSNCIVGEMIYAESQASAPVSALGVVALSCASGSAVSVSDSLMWGGNFTGASSGAGIVNGGAVVVSDSEVTAFSTGSSSGTGTFVNTGTATASGSRFASNDRCLYSSGPFTADDCEFSTAPINAVAGTSANCVALSGSTNTMDGCTITSTINQINVVGTSLIWSDTSIGAYAFLSGSMSASFNQCVVSAVEMSGASVSAAFLSCVILGSSNANTSVSNFGNNAPGNVVGIAVLSGASCQITSCTNDGNNAVIASGASPVVSGCYFTSYGTVDVIDVESAASPLVINTTFLMGEGTSSRAVNILDTVSNPSVSGCFFQAPASLAPSVLVDGIVGSQLQYGINTPSLGAVTYSTNINLTALDSGFVSYTALTSESSGQGASIVGLQPIVGSVPANFQITATDVQTALQQVEAGMNVGMNAGGYVLGPSGPGNQTGVNQLRPYASATPDENLNIAAGTFKKSDGVSSKTFGGGSTTFSAPASVQVYPQSRIDVVYITDSGSIGIVVGALSGSSPAVPTYSTPGLAIAEVTCQFAASQNSAPTISPANINDIRPFLTSQPSSPFPPGFLAHTAATTAPAGWLVRDGTVYNIADYAALGAILGPQHALLPGNPGDPNYPANGVTTFAVPDDRGLADIGAGLGTEPAVGTLTTKTLYTAYGEELHVLTIPEIPSHAHAVWEANQTGGNLSGTAGYDPVGSSNTGATGGGGAHNNIQPSRAYTPIIKT